MKLSLARKRDIEILTAQGRVDEHQAEVIRAGIGKIFQNGHNRIVLELTDARTLPNAVLKSLAELNALARELSGEIVLAGVDAETAARISLLSMPPLITCFRDREAALQSFGAPPPANELPPDQPPDPKSPAATAQTGGDAELRAENERLRAENHDLLTSLEKIVMGRRSPEDLKTAQERIHRLEDETLRLVNRIRELGGEPN